MNCNAIELSFFDRDSPSTAAKVRVIDFLQLLSGSSQSLSIDSYQRPYVWGKEKAAQLLADLREHTDSAPSNLAYYMGTILLHQSAEKLFIIDGQQRLTTLCLLYRQLHGRLPVNCQLTFRSPESWSNIRTIANLLAAADTQLPPADLFDSIRFTVITVDSEDLAFTFFDTQNNRGIPLAATDLLKAFHLRAIPGQDDHSLALQKDCAARWERLQQIPALLGPGSDFAPSLFNFFLWRSRRWTGNSFDTLPSHDELIDEFQTRSLLEPLSSPAASNTIPLYSARGNRRAKVFTLVPGDGYRLHAEEIYLSDDTAELPFAVRQPISAGVGFFLYAEKYAALAHQLLRPNHEHAEVRAFRKFHEAVTSNVSIYLRELFLLASVMFVDQFGYRKLFEFSLWLDHALGALRIEKAYIFKEAPLNFLKGQPRNLLDIIASAFRPEEVIQHLKSLPHPREIYSNLIIERDGVQRIYEQSVIRYYEKSNISINPRLANRHIWISEKVNKEGLA